MKCFLIIPDGVGIRNFVYSEFIDFVSEKFEIVIWHSFFDQSMDDVLKHSNTNDINCLKLPFYRESIFEKISRNARVYAQLHWTKKKATPRHIKLSRSKKGLSTKIINSIAEVCGYFFSTKSKIVFLDEMHINYTKSNQRINYFKEVLLKEKPDVVFCTHQRSELAIPAITAARTLQIPTITFIYSWDNLPKNRMGVQPDYYFVWGDKMKEELLEFYPKTEELQIFKTGTPQFEFYFDPSLVKSKEQFFSEFDLNCEKKVICFSGDDIFTSPYDPYYLADLADAVRNISEIDRPQILFRQCPVDKSNRFDWVLEKFPEIRVSEPLWESADGQNWSGIVPRKDDVALLTNIVHHCDLVANLGSTMAMDFAIMDKPSIYFAYNPVTNEPKMKWDVKEIYKLPHFDLIHEIQPIHWVSNPAHLSELIKAVLKNPGQKSRERRKWLQRVLTFPLEDSSQRIADKLVEIAKQSSNQSLLNGK